MESELLKLYYARLFPHGQMFEWLSYGKASSRAPKQSATTDAFQNREFCFTLDGDIFVRYQCFKDAREMQTAIVARCPAKIDIGPVYTRPPRDRALYKGEQFKPVEREFVVDIDLTDYDTVRTCCSEANVCSRCWALVAVAVQVLDAALRNDFAFQNILWVFSGRRGIHCWVCDRRARELSDEARASVAAFLSVYRGTEHGRAKLALPQHMHPALTAAYDILLPAWTQEVLPGQGLLSDPQRCDAVLAYVPDSALTERLRQRWAGGAGGRGGARGADGDVNLRRWNELVEEVEAAAAASRRAKRGGEASALSHSLKEIVFAYCYPRLDVDVSKKMNHLLKAPFCIHPKTGKVCVPLEASCAAEFDVDAVPTMRQLADELSNKMEEDGVQGQGSEWRGTSLAPAMEVFCRFLRELKGDTAPDQQDLTW